jgi:hypothetical protein
MVVDDCSFGRGTRCVARSLLVDRGKKTIFLLLIVDRAEITIFWNEGGKSKFVSLIGSTAST